MALPTDPLPVAEIVAQQRFLRSVARQLVRDAATADDVVQEAYLRALDRRGERPRRLRAWLGRVVANLARDRRRGDARRDAREQAVAAAAGSATAPEGSPAAIAARVEMHRRLADRVLALAPAYRDVVLLHHFEGRTVAEVAARLGIPFETARTRLRRALELLRGELEVELGGREELLAALLPLATFVVPAMPPVSPPTSASSSTTASASTTAAAVATSGALIGVPLAMSTTTKVALAAVLTAIAGGVWLWSDATIGDPPPRLDSTRATDGGAPEAPPVFDSPAPVEVAAERATAPRAGSDAALPQSGRAGLRVRTVWSDATPAPRIRLRLEPLDPRDGFETLRRATSDDGGVLLLDDLDAGDVVVAAAGFAPMAGEFDVPRDPLAAAASAKVTLVAGTIVDATLTLPVGPPMRGVVVDGSRKPIAGAEIWVSDRPQAWSAGDVVTRSDGSGEFTLPVVEGGHFAAARAEGFGWSEVVSIGAYHDPAPRLELQLDRPGATVRGVVRDGGGRPVAGALVLAHDGSRGSRLSGDGHILGDPPPLATRSGADGAFRLEWVPFGSIELFADHARFAPRSTKLEVAAPDVVHDLTLEGGGTLVLHVVDERGFDVAGAAVELQLLAGPSMNLRSLMRRATTGAAGIAELERLPACVAFLTGTAPGRAKAMRTLHLAAGAQSEELVLRAPLRLRGRVVDEDGRGCAGIKVELVPADAQAAELPPPCTTDDDGRFEFADCADVAYVANLYPAEGMSFLAARRGIAVRPGEEEVVLLLDAAHRASASIRGRLVAADGKTVERAGIQFAPVGGNVVASTAVQPDGRFEIGPLPPGTYWVIASGDGFASRSFGDVLVAAGETRDLGDLALERPAILRVHARRHDGQRVKPADLALARGGKRYDALFTFDGDALRAELSSGDAFVEVVGPGLAWKRVAARCTAGATTDVDLDLESGLDARYVVSRRDGAPLGASLRLTATDASGEALTEELHPLPDALDVTTSCCLAPGEWTLEVVAPDGARAEAVITVGRSAAKPTATLVLAK